MYKVLSLCLGLFCVAGCVPESRQKDAQSSVKNDSVILNGVTQTTESKIFGLLNQERRAKGLAPLSWNAKLGDAAKKHADDMAARGYASHVTPDGLTHQDRVNAQGYIYCHAEENIAQGISDPAKVIQTWMRTPASRANILSRAADEVGVGIGADNTWVLVFGAQNC